LKLNLGTLLLVVVVLGFLLIRYVGALVWTPWRVVGLAIFVPAFVLFVLARIELRRAFSLNAKASTLVTTRLIFAHRPWWLLEAKFGDAYRDYRRRTWF
jgi:protein-S-isoprenylcysteine O-methyltransferase Ste14